MNLPVTPAIWLGEGEVCTIEHLADVSGLSPGEVKDVIVSGVIWPSDAATQPCCFRLMHVVTVRQACRLRDDFYLDSNRVALAMTLLRRISVLEQALSMHPRRGAGSDHIPDLMTGSSDFARAASRDGTLTKRATNAHGLTDTVYRRGKLLAALITCLPPSRLVLHTIFGKTCPSHTLSN